MGISVDTAVTVSVVTIAVGSAGCIWAIVLIAMRRSVVADRIDTAISLRQRLIQLTYDWPRVAALVVFISTFVPWVSGSAVGVDLPDTLWGLPWIKWPAVIGAVVMVAITAVLPYRRQTVAAVATVLGFFVCVVIGVIMFLLTVLAERLSRYSFSADTVLRGFGLSDQVLPVVREGAGAPVFALGALFGMLVTPRLFRRSEPATFAFVEPTDEDWLNDRGGDGDRRPDGRFEVGDEWWT